MDSSAGGAQIKLPAGVVLRPRRLEDDGAIVRIYAEQEPDSAPLTVERCREECEAPGPSASGERWVAAAGAEIAGAVDFRQAWWTRDPGVFSLWLRVKRQRQGQGIGSALFELARERLQERGAERLVGWVREDAEAGRRFAARRGFQETGELIQEYRLHVPEANLNEVDERERRLRKRGVRILFLADAGTDETLLHRLHRLWAFSGAEPPDPEQFHSAFPGWRREVLEGAGLSPETHWIALDGETPVGMTFLRRLTRDAAENDYTGVALTHRGHGIAAALKARTVAWARSSGVEWFYTSSEIENAPMIAVNTRLGYRPGARRIGLERELP